MNFSPDQLRNKFVDFRGENDGFRHESDNAARKETERMKIDRFSAKIVTIMPRYLFSSSTPNRTIVGIVELMNGIINFALFSEENDIIVILCCGVA